MTRALSGVAFARKPSPGAPRSDFTGPATPRSDRPAHQSRINDVIHTRRPGHELHTTHLALVGEPCWGYDIGEGPLAVARSAGFDARQADITSDELELAGIVVLSEVLEHLVDPHTMVARLCQDPVRTIVASSPHLETDADHYEQHRFAWDLDGYTALLEDAGFTVKQRQTVGIFQAQLAVR